MEATKRKSSDTAINSNDSKRIRSQDGDFCSDICHERVMALERRVEEFKVKFEVISKLEEKVDSLSKIFEKFQAESKSSSIVSFDLLNNKVDKMVRLFGQTLETSSKITEDIKMLKAEIESAPKPHTGGKFSMAGALRLAQKIEKRAEKKNASDKEEPNSTPVDRLADYRWGQNLMLLGDNLWRSFRIYEDVNNDIRLMEKEVNLKVSCRENEVLSKLYDPQRDKLLFAVPPRIFRIALSVGAHEVMSDPDLVTLNDASFDACREKNLPILTKKAQILKALILKCHSAKVQVILVIPASGTKRSEVFKLWEEVLLNELEGIISSNLKILNFQDIIRSSAHDFKSHDELLRAWFINTEVGTLSAYGTRRLYDALKRLARVGQKSSAGPTEYCPRCTRSHPNGQKSCKSIDRACRLCGLLGHFQEAHGIVDPERRREVVDLLGCDIYDASLPLVHGCAPNPDQANGKPVAHFNTKTA